MGVCSFSSGDNDSLYSNEGESSVDESGNESCKISCLARESVGLSPCSRIVPVSESSAVVIRSSTESDDETDDNLSQGSDLVSKVHGTHSELWFEPRLTRPRKHRTLIIEVMNSDSP